MSKRKTTEEFIEEARKVHGDKYDYSHVLYVNNRTKVCIICNEHREFWQAPQKHLSGQGCPICYGTPKKTIEQFIEDARKVHGDKYDYSKVNYVDAHTKVCIICPTHGEFWQKPNCHLQGQGCPSCYGTPKKTTKIFIDNAIKIHGSRYDYSKVNYVDAHTKVCIICPKHGEFWQKPNDHLQSHACPICNSSKLENEIRQFLTKNQIRFQEQYRAQWLGLQSLDFYLPDYKVGIECQGIQHFKSCDYFGGETKFKLDIERDKHKFEKCKENGVELLYYSNLGINYPYKVIEDKVNLLNEIKTRNICNVSQKVV